MSRTDDAGGDRRRMAPSAIGRQGPLEGVTLRAAGHGWLKCASILSPVRECHEGQKRIAGSCFLAAIVIAIP
jgi:hypothetical protein